MSKIHDDNYYQVSGWMINRLGLKGVALNVYAILYGFTQDGESEFTGSIQYLCDFCGGATKPTIRKALKELTDKNYIIRREETVSGVTFVRYKISLPVVKNLYGGGKEILGEGGKISFPNNKDIDTEIIQKNIMSVIDYLNMKAGTKYRATTPNTRKHLNARFADGYTVDDCKSVIDKKCAEWKGTKWEQYLRPDTLFGSKFESYLNAKTQTKEVNPYAGIDSDCMY